MLEDITLWAVKTDSARVEPNEAGGYDVTLNAMASQVQAESTGKRSKRSTSG